MTEPVPPAKASNLPIFVAIGVVAMACMGGIYYLYNNLPDVFAGLPDPDETTCGELFAMNQGKIAYVIGRVTIYYQFKGGDVSTDEKTDAFAQRLIGTCSKQNDKKVIAVVDEILANPS